MAKTTRKKLSAATQSNSRKVLTASATTSSRTKAAPAKVAVQAKAAAPAKAAASGRPVLAAAKVATKSSALAEKARPAKASVSHKTVEARSGRAEIMPPRPIPEAVPTNGKPRKNEAGLHSRDLEHFRDMLLAKRRELVGDMSQMEREALRTSGNSNLSTLPIHMADMGTDNYEQEFTLTLVEKDRNLLREINSALAKIQNGTFGICEGTGNPISKPRLEAQPWARYSIEYARQIERPGGFRRII